MESTASNILGRRHLLRILVSSNLKRQNKNTALGYLWWLLDPILMTAVYYFLVAVLFRRGGDIQPYLLFVLCGLLSWKAFGDSVSQSVLSIRSQANIIKSIGFPKAVLPLSLVFSNAVYFAVALLVAMSLAAFYGPQYQTWPNIYYLMLPVVIVLQMLFTTGVVLVMAVLGVYFQDMANLIGHILRMWFFLSPGLYSIDLVPDRLQSIFRLNPFCGLMTAYRDIIMYGRMPAVFDLLYPLVVGLLSLGLGYAVFRRYEGRLVQKL